MRVHYLTDINNFRTIITNTSDRPAVFDFIASSSESCKATSPIINRFSAMNELKGVDFYRVDIEAASAISQEAQVTSVPTFALYKNGARTKVVTGANLEALQDLVVTAAL
ncbi:hypothetical protein VTN00DRAFT_4670 [Thermoascus crustaceus]|uniref:uncharacterized protein n=1 Tax=Thermoascus crustaceus TaxID=5088 RepID=UPI0037441530